MTFCNFRHQNMKDIIYYINHIIIYYIYSMNIVKSYTNIEGFIK